LKKNNLMEILPFMINKYPELDPKNVIDEDIIQKFPKKIIYKSFEFMKYSDNVRKIIYSYDIFIFKCLWCGIEIECTGHEFFKHYGKHREECHKCFFVTDSKGLFTIKKNKNSFILINHLQDNGIGFELKKDTDNEILDVIGIELRNIRKNYNVNLIKNIYDTYKEYIELK